MEKPNLERIAEVFETELRKHVFKEDLNDTYNARLKQLETIWGQIVYYQNTNGDEEFLSNYYYYPEIESLENLCKEYGLSSFYPDLRFIAFQLTRKTFVIDLHKNQKEDVLLFHRTNVELLSILSILDKYKKGITLKITRNQQKQSVTQNQDIINVINESLKDYFKKLNPITYVGSGEPPFKNWSEYIEYFTQNEKRQLNEFQTYEKGKAFLVKNAVFNLWTYLQSYTTLKAKEGSEYSNEQAEFIFSFLEKIGIIDKSKYTTSKKADNIGYYLKTYKKINPVRYVVGKAKQ